MKSSQSQFPEAVAQQGISSMDVGGGSIKELTTIVGKLSAVVKVLAPMLASLSLLDGAVGYTQCHLV